MEQGELPPRALSLVREWARLRKDELAANWTSLRERGTFARIVRELQDARKFAAIRVEMDTVVCENGFDLAPEFLYANAKARSSAH